MAITVAIWGSTFVVVKGALKDTTPAAFHLIRMTLAAVLLAIANHRAWRRLRRTYIAAHCSSSRRLATAAAFSVP